MTRSYDMRNPARPGYDDGLQVTVRRNSLWERFSGAIWLLFSNWRCHHSYDQGTLVNLGMAKLYRCAKCGKSNVQ